MPKTISALLVAAACVSAAPSIEADARRGAEFFSQNACNGCHAPGSARDLARRLDRNYTPAALASRIWNHAPTMFAAMKSGNITPPSVSDQQAADLFAFFYSRRYFERPGDAARGKRVFTEKGCAGCHNISSPGTGPAVTTWGSLTDPVSLVGAMWNHAPRMKAAIEGKGGKWPDLTPQDMADLLVYLQNQPEAKKASVEFLLPPTGSGKELFAERCGGCHKAAASLENKLKDETLTDVAVAMWNHAPMMKQSGPELSPDEMRKIVAYAWGSQFLQAHGNADRGKKVFEGKKCGSCHSEAGGAPSLASLPKPFGPINLVSVVFDHGPKMEARLKSKGVEWPMLTPGEVSDLSAYLGK